MEFAEGSIRGEKVIDGKVFPRTFVPLDASGLSTRDLAGAVSAHRESLVESLREHGAVLFRGYRVDSAEEFLKVVEAFGWEEQQYPLPTNRVRLCDRVYTASEIPLHVFIIFHHEMSMVKKFCSKILFMCLVAPPEGGETSIVRSDVVVEEMEEAVPEAVEKFREHGMICHVRYKERYNIDEGRSNKVWHQIFSTEDEEEAKRRAVEILGCNSVTLNDDGTADLLYGPLNPIKELGGRRVWFCDILDYTTEKREVVMSYGDGTPLPPEALRRYRRILEENCVDVGWEKGDVLVVDNHRVQHARRPGKPPRRVLVSLCK